MLIIYMQKTEIFRPSRAAAAVVSISLFANYFPRRQCEQIWRIFTTLAKF